MQVQQQQAGGGAGKGPGRDSGMGIDTKQLGMPDIFEGVDSKWRDWNILARSYFVVANPEIQEVMRLAETEAQAPLNLELVDAGSEQASHDLYHLLLSLCRKQALDKVINAGSLEGARAWRALLDTTASSTCR